MQWGIYLLIFAKAEPTLLQTDYNLTIWGRAEISKLCEWWNFFLTVIGEQVDINVIKQSNRNLIFAEIRWMAS